MDHLLKIVIEILGPILAIFLMSQMSRKRRKRDLDTLEDALNKRVKEVLENGRTED